MIKMFKKYLSIDEAITYLSENQPLEAKLKDLQELERFGQIKPLIYIAEIIFSKFWGENYSDGTQIIKGDEAVISSYLKPCNFMLLDIHITQRCIEFPFGHFKFRSFELFEIEHLTYSSTNKLSNGDKGMIFDQSSDPARPITEVGYKQVFIKRSELDELLQSTSKNNNRIKQLEQELEQAKANQVPEGQGDTLLILGAVMESIKEVAKPNYTQESLIQKIITKYGNTPGISESTLKKKFPEAKRYLNQRFKP